MVEEKFLLAAGDEVLTEEGGGELCLVIAELVLIEVEGVVGGNVGWGELTGEDCVGVDPTQPGVEQDLFQSLQ